ncbi:hypothetical protein C8Z91_18160 [Paenibacillus elgii]|uniref:DUF4878 domain-containing protein n=1 Tax=Paenibacillus elgii TaxID=189691 RepID=A0A2T6G146_9BACL|nr:DUF4878 domain-containing protein [Paenibacillus elgii]PUA37884.1 hypothetical protein C8Z91_18160 [Paenibacillus elgii]
MKQFHKISCIILLVFLAGCGDREATGTEPLTKNDVQQNNEIKKELVDIDPQAADVIQLFFENYNDIYKWSNYASSNYLEALFREFLEGPIARSLNENIDKYAKVANEKNIRKLTNYEIIRSRQINEDEIRILVKRLFSDNYTDQTSFRLKKIENEWKFDGVFYGDWK